MSDLKIGSAGTVRRDAPTLDVNAFGRSMSKDPKMIAAVFGRDGSARKVLSAADETRLAVAVVNGATKDQLAAIANDPMARSRISDSLSMAPDGSSAVQPGIDALRTLQDVTAPIDVSQFNDACGFGGCMMKPNRDPPLPRARDADADVDIDDVYR